MWPVRTSWSNFLFWKNSRNITHKWSTILEKTLSVVGSHQVKMHYINSSSLTVAACTHLKIHLVKTINHWYTEFSFLFMCRKHYKSMIYTWIIRSSWLQVNKATWSMFLWRWYGQHNSDTVLSSISNMNRLILIYGVLNSLKSSLKIFMFHLSALIKEHLHLIHGSEITHSWSKLPSIRPTTQ